MKNKCECGGNYVYQGGWIGPGPNAKCDTCGRSTVLTTDLKLEIRDSTGTPLVDGLDYFVS